MQQSHLMAKSGEGDGNGKRSLPPEQLELIRKRRQLARDRRDALRLENTLSGETESPEADGAAELPLTQCAKLTSRQLNPQVIVMPGA